MIQENNFDELYRCARKVGTMFIESLTEGLLKSNINPEEYLTKLPEYYMFNNLNCRNVKLSITEFQGTNHFSGSLINSIQFAEGTTHIPQACCAYCYDLSSVTIPASVQYIRAHAFIGCSHLKYVVFKGTIEQWNKIIVEYSDLVWQNVPADHVLCIDGKCSLIPVYTN